MNMLRTAGICLIVIAGLLGVFGASLDPPPIYTEMMAWVVGDGERGTHKDAPW